MEQQTLKIAKNGGEPFVIAGWYVDPTSLRISNDKKSIKIEPRAMAVLDYLARKPGIVVSRQELEDEVWAGTIVGYDAISNAIIKLRKAFGDKARKPRIIETIAKSGYRLVAEVSFPDETESSVATSVEPELVDNTASHTIRVTPDISSPERRWWIVAALLLITVLGGTLWWQSQILQVEAASLERMAFPLPDKPSIAVLPFINLSDDRRQEYFADGMTDDLITDLSKLPELFVISRNSTFTYKGKAVKIRQVAEELGVHYVMEGSVRRVDNQVRINAQLIDATTGGHVWAERYDGSLQDIFSLQDQVTRQIVAALKVSLTDEEEAQYALHTTDNARAHDAFLQGWAHYKLEKPADLARGIPYLEEAIRLDPQYAQAHALLASIFWDAYVNDWAFDLGMPSFKAEELANKYLEESLKMPNPLAYAHQSRVYLSLGFPGEAVREAEKAVALDSNDATSHATLANALVNDGRLQDGADAIRKAIRLDPHHPPNYLAILGAAQFGLERFEEAAKTFERTLKRNPNNEKALIYLASSYGYLGRMREAEDTIEAANDLRRATLGLGPLSLEKASNLAGNPFKGEIDFPSFGPKQAQDRLRKGLSNIPALTWQYLIRQHLILGEGNTWYEIEGATEIDLATAKSFYDRGVLFIDVGTEAEGHWKEGHIPGAVNLPRLVDDTDMKRFRETTFREVADKSDEVVIYWCTLRGDYCIPNLSLAKAVNWGYQKVYYFDGGATAWKKAGYPIETDG